MVMTQRKRPLVFRERVLGWFGLLLLGVVGWACEWGDRSHRRGRRARLLLVWMVIETVTIIGWTIDRLLPIDSRDDASGLVVVDPKTHGGVR
jgi:hypothetical protein